MRASRMLVSAMGHQCVCVMTDAVNTAVQTGGVSADKGAP